MLRVVEHLRGELRTMSQRWYTGTGDGPALAREAMEGIVEVYAAAWPGAARAGRRGRPTTPRSSGSTAASCSPSSTSPTRHIEAEIEAGRVLPLDAKETARALVWMMERYLNRSLGREPADTPRETVVETLTTIWTRVLYGAASTDAAPVHSADHVAPVAASATVPARAERAAASGGRRASRAASAASRQRAREQPGARGARRSCSA